MIKKRIEDTFFLISDENIDSVPSKVYGFLYKDDKFLVNCNPDEHFAEDEINSSYFSKNFFGSYIAVINKNNIIKIFSSYPPPWYIYYYKNNNIFCISNNFWSICNYLKNKIKITLDETYALQFISTSMSPLSVRRTLSNEIKCVDIFYEIVIDKKRGLNFVKNFNYSGNMKIDTREGIENIDKWIQFYSRMIRNLSENNLFLKFDLSGGFDSRVILSLAIKSGINLSADNISIFSKIPKTTSEIEHYCDDYDIALKISKKFQFSLNSPLKNIDRQPITEEATWDIFKNTFLCCHRQPYFEFEYFNSPLFYFGGINGEPVRGKIRSKEEWVGFFNNPFWNIVPCCIELFNDLFSFSDKSMYKNLLHFYLSTWSRNHYGMSILSKFIINCYSISPFNNFMLYQYNDIITSNSISHEILYALILKRTAPELLEIPFAHNECFDSKTLKYVEHLDKQFPQKNSVDNQLFIFIDKKCYQKHNNINNTHKNKISIDKLVTSIYEESYQNFTEKFMKFGKMTYDHALQYSKNKHNFFSLQHLIPIIAISKCIDIEKKSGFSTLDFEDNTYIGMRRLINNFPELLSLKEKFCQFLDYKKIYNVEFYHNINILLGYNSKSDLYNFLAAKYYNFHKKYDLAIYHIKKSIKLKYKHTYISEYILILRRQNRHDFAIHEINEYINKDSTFAAGWAHKAYINKEVYKNIDEAIFSISKAIELQPNNEFYKKVYNELTTRRD